MNCIEETCNGKINKDEGINVRVNCRSARPAFPCEECGRLHFLGDSGAEGIHSRAGGRAFFADNEIVLK